MYLIFISKTELRDRKVYRGKPYSTIFSWIQWKFRKCYNVTCWNKKGHIFSGQYSSVLEKTFKVQKNCANAGKISSSFSFHQFFQVRQNELQNLHVKKWVLWRRCSKKLSPTEVWSTLLIIFARFCSFDSNIPVDSFSIILTFPSLNPVLQVVRFWVQACEHEHLNKSLSTCMLVQDPPLKISHAIIYLDIYFFLITCFYISRTKTE